MGKERPSTVRILHALVGVQSASTPTEGEGGIRNPPSNPLLWGMVILILYNSSPPPHQDKNLNSLMTPSQEMIKVKGLENRVFYIRQSKSEGEMSDLPCWHPGQWYVSLFGGHIHCVALVSQDQTAPQIPDEELRGRGWLKRGDPFPGFSYGLISLGQKTCVWKWSSLKGK